ncbi:MAG: hypothetical protein LBM08_01340 [Dysgonamonadaceae bacterium]|jgi:hypothetical protein|nr:hypothetical protein [Dysgonamonadaceae bacterium]
MDTQNILIDIFRYFAKFIGRDGVLRNFTAGKGDAYTELKSHCQVLPEAGSFPDITDYVFGVNESSVEKRINNIKGIYLFIDYGNFLTSRNANNVKIDELHLAVTVAKPLNIETVDLAAEVLLADRLLNIIRTIRRRLIDDKDDNFVRRLTFPSEITPWYSRELNNSTGWTMLFKLTGVDLL